MLIKYKNTSIEKLCNTERAAKKFFDHVHYYGDLQAVLNLIKQSTALSDLIAFQHLHFHSTDFYMKNSFSLDIGGRKSPYRLIILLIDDAGNVLVKDEDFYSKCKQIKIIEIEEVSKHYE